MDVTLFETLRPYLAPLLASGWARRMLVVCKPEGNHVFGF
jgi:hypothetical protein